MVTPYSQNRVAIYVDASGSGLGVVGLDRGSKRSIFRVSARLPSNDLHLGIPAKEGEGLMLGVRWADWCGLSPDQVVIYTDSKTVCDAATNARLGLPYGDLLTSTGKSSRRLLRVLSEVNDGFLAKVQHCSTKLNRADWYSRCCAQVWLRPRIF